MLPTLDHCNDFPARSMAVQYRDPLNTLITVRELQLALDDWNQSPPPPAHVARRQLADCVAQSLPPPPDPDTADGPVRPDTPWFEAWRQRLLQVGASDRQTADGV